MELIFGELMFFFIMLSGADPRIFDRGGPDFTHYDETVLRLTTSTPATSIYRHWASHSIALASLTI